MGTMSGDPRSIPELIGGLASDISMLFRKEIQLAKAEASEKVSQVLGGAEVLVAGGVLALGALGVLLAAIVTALAAWFTGMGMNPTWANSLAALIVAGVVGAIAWMLINRGLASLRASNLQLNRTGHSLGRDADIVKERL